MKKSLTIAYLATFSLFFAIPLVCSDFSASSGILENEKRMQAPPPTLMTEDGQVNPQLKQECSSWLNDRIGLRQFAIKTHSKRFMRQWGGIDNPDVVLGKDGFLFYTHEENIEIGRGIKRVKAEDLELITANQKDIAQFLKDKGAQYILVLTPSKSSIYAENLPSIVVSSYTVCDQIANHLKAQVDFPVLNIKPALLALKQKSPDLLFHKNDTHWNHRGTYAAYCEIISQLNHLGIVSGHAFPVHLGEELSSTGDLSRLFGYTSGEAVFTAPRMVLDEDGSVYQKGDRFAQVKAIAESYGCGKGVIYLTNDTAEKRTLLIFGDSMWAAGLNLPKYLSQHFSTVVFVRTDDKIMCPDLVDFLKPDVVIYGITERFQPIRLLTRFL